MLCHASKVVPNKGEQNQKWPLPSPGPKRGRKCYVTPAFSGFRNAKRRAQNQKWSPTKKNKIRRCCLTSAAQKRAEMLRHPCIHWDARCQARGATSEVVPKQRGTNSKMAASRLPSRGSKRGRKCYVTPAFSGIRNAKHGEQNWKWSPTKGNEIRSGCLTSVAKKRAEMLRHPCIHGVPYSKRGGRNQKWLPHPCLLGGPKEGGKATSPLHSRGSPTPSAGSKIRSGAQQRGTKSEVGAAHRWPKRGRKCYVTLAFSGIPNAKRGGRNQKGLPHPCLLGGPKEGGKAMSPLHSRGSPTPSAGSKIRSGPQQRGTKSEVGAAHRWPKRGQKCYVTLAFSGMPNAKRGGRKGEQIQKWLPHAYLLGGPKEGRNATSPLHSRGSPTPSAGSKIRSGPQQRGTKSEVATSPGPCRGPKWGWKCYVSPAFSGFPNAKHGGQNQKWSQQRGTKSEGAASRLPSRGPQRGRVIFFCGKSCNFVCLFFLR